MDSNKIMTLGEYGFWHGLLIESINCAPREIVILSSDAADNASDTVGKANRFSVGGRFSEEFVFAWKNTFLGLLSDYPQPKCVIDWLNRHHLQASKYCTHI